MTSYVWPYWAEAVRKMMEQMKNGPAPTGDKERDDILAGGVLRTRTRPTLDLLLLLRASSASMSIYPEGKSCSDLGGVVVVGDPGARRG